MWINPSYCGEVRAMANDEISFVKHYYIWFNLSVMCRYSIIKAKKVVIDQLRSTLCTLTKQMI
jgi:hypothetical protein